MPFEHHLAIDLSNKHCTVFKKIWISSIVWQLAVGYLSWLIPDLVNISLNERLISTFISLISFPAALSNWISDLKLFHGLQRVLQSWGSHRQSRLKVFRLYHTISIIGTIMTLMRRWRRSLKRLRRSASIIRKTWKKVFVTTFEATLIGSK